MDPFTAAMIVTALIPDYGAVADKVNAARDEGMYNQVTELDAAQTRAQYAISRGLQPQLTYHYDQPEYHKTFGEKIFGSGLLQQGTDDIAKLGHTLMGQNTEDVVVNGQLNTSYRPNGKTTHTMNGGKINVTKQEHKY